VYAERDKLDRRWSTKLTVPATVDSQFITLIVQLCLQHDAVQQRIARVGLRQLIVVAALCNDLCSALISLFLY